MFLGALESCRSQLSRRCFTLLMWPVFVLQFNFGFLSNGAGGEVHLIILFLHWFWTILHVLGCVRKLGITPFRGMFQLVNVASTCLAIKFRVLTYYIGWHVHLLTSLSTYSGLLSNIIFMLLLSTTPSTNSTMLSQNSSEKWMNCAVFRHHISEFSRRHPSKLRKVISNSDIKSPAQQHQPLSLHHHHHCVATHCRHRALIRVVLVYTRNFAILPYYLWSYK